MIGYFDFFPDKATTELRTATFEGESCDDSIPAGTYLFTEYYCTDFACDCERLLVKVLRVRSESTPLEDVATISYTWNEQPGSKWSMLTADIPNPFLDPFHRQTKYAKELLDFWREMIARDPGYAKRLERHYHELRAALAQAGGTSRPAFQPEARAPRKPLATPSLTKPERRDRKRRLQHGNRARKRR